MKLRPPALVVLPLAALLLAGCGASSPSATAKATSSPTVPGSTTSTKGAAGSSSTPSPGAIASAGKGSTSGATGPEASAVATSSPSPSAAAAPSFTAPGRYTYETHGSVTAGTPRKVDGTAELTVDKPTGDKQHSALGGDQGGTEQDVLHQSNGTYLVRLALTTGGQNKEFRPATPVLGHPRPASLGRSWSWAMTSTDGKTHASYAAKIVRQETLTIGGTQVATWVIDSTLRLTGDLTYTDHETTWYDEGRLLQVKTRTQGSGNFSGIAFTTDVTSTLRSVKPS